MKTIWLTFIVLMSGCAPSYWMLDSELRAARAGNVATVEAHADGEKDPLHLKAESLESIRPDETNGRVVHVTPRHTRLKVGWALLGIGASLGVIAVMAGVIPSHNCTGDEECWLPQLIAGATLGGIGGATMIAGGVVAGTSLHESESR